MNNDTLTKVWLGHFGLETLSFMVKDLCESITFIQDLAHSEGKTANVAGFLAQIATIVAYCETSYGEDQTVEALGEANADPEVILKAQEAMKA